MANYSELKQELKEISPLLTVLGDEKRQAIIIRLLEMASCQGLQVGELTEATGLSRPAISHHLKILKDAKLIGYRTEGTRNYYFLRHDPSELLKLQAFIGNVLQIMGRNKQE